jgi:hypothetical protein
MLLHRSSGWLDTPANHCHVKNRQSLEAVRRLVIQERFTSMTGLALYNQIKSLNQCVKLRNLEIRSPVIIRKLAILDSLISLLYVGYNCSALHHIIKNLPDCVDTARKFFRKTITFFNEPVLMEAASTFHSLSSSTQQQWQDFAEPVKRQ